jgi:hypothetical protein
VVGEDHASDCSVLEELVGPFQVEEVCVPAGAGRQVTHGQLDLADADNGKLHGCSVPKVQQYAAG